MKKSSLTMISLFLASCQLFAQDGKLKNIQTGTGVWAPAVKVDGNLSEWDDNFQAYNKQTKLFYTLSNDDKFLYLVVKSIDIPNNNKIAAGGITFTINTDGKKKDNDAFAITYPVITRKAGGPGDFHAGPGRPGGFGGGDAIRIVVSDGAGGARGNGPDSAAMAARHKQTVDAAKEIKVLGFKDITDTLISVYNEYSIKAAIGYDKLGNYDYELAIPLKMLNLSPGDNKELAYNLKVNGISFPAGFQHDDHGGDRGGPPGGGFGGGGFGGAGGGGAGGGGGGDAVRVMDVAPGGPGGGPGGGGFAEMFSPTDVWGKYTLAKK